MRAKIVLADSAEVREGLLFMLGGGWNAIGPQPQPFAIAGVLVGEWDEANTPHTALFSIEDEDGNPLMIPGVPQAQPFVFRAAFEFGRPPGAARGTSFNIPVALAIPPIPWTPGRRYVLLVRVADDVLDRVPFSVRAAPPPPQPPTLPPPQDG
jgi:hypothetical protein